MSTPLYTITKDEDTGLSTATIIFADGSTRAINSTNADFAALVQAVVIDGADEDAIRELLTPALAVGKSLRALSERIRFDSNQIWFDGDVVDSALTKHIVRILAEGADENKWRALVNFMEKLYTNPSKKSIESLYEFLVRQDFTILPDGDFIAYKGLRADGTSIHAGYGIVNGVAFERANLKNDLGAIVEIPRSKVDADTSVGCSTGLHAGSYSYAKGFARGMLVTVKINPRDVVSVPDDCSYQKIRTARYVVLSQTEVEDTRTTWADEDDDWDEDEDFEDEYDESRDEAISALEAWRDENDDAARDFEESPLSRVEVSMLEDASEYDYLSEDEDSAVSAYYKVSRASGGVPADQFANSLVKAAKTFEDVKVAPLVVTSAGPLSKPTAVEFARQLRAEIEGEENIVLSFDYTRGDGSSTSVEGFTPSEVDERGSDLLITGKNAEGQWRSYYYGQMENISVRDADTEPKHAS